MNLSSHLVTFCTSYIWMAHNLEKGSFVVSKINDYHRIFILQKRGLKCCLWKCDAFGICLIGWCLELVISVNSLSYNTLSLNSLCCAICFVMCTFLQETGQIYVLQLELCIYTLISCVPLQSKLDCWNPQWIQEILFTLRIMSCNSFPQDCLRVFQGFYRVSPRKFPVDVLTFAFLKFFSLGSDQ